MEKREDGQTDESAWFCRAVRISEVLLQDEKIYAHISEKRRDGTAAGQTDPEEPERLSEHIERCFYYFQALCREKNLTKTFDRMREELLPAVTDAAADLFREMVVNTVIFHDMGKMNPAFQRIKMHNLQLGELKNTGVDGSVHAMLSAAVYTDYFLARLAACALPKKETELLHVLVLANAYVISRHHLSLSAFTSFLNEFETNQKLYQIFTAMEAGVYAGLYRGPFYHGAPALTNLKKKNSICIERFYAGRNAQLPLYTYIRFLYSLLVSCDYYAATEYFNGVKMKDFGTVSDIGGLYSAYEQSPLLETIRRFDPAQYEDDGKDINILRNGMFYEAEQNLQANRDKDIYFLEAPTGSGKSNIALNISLKLLDEKVRKIFYVYPFNTLVEQNMDALEKIFGQTDFYRDIAVINSITPIRTKGEEEGETQTTAFYQEALLDRQFLNYPFVLTTSVHLFEMLFGCQKEGAVSFYQLAGSVVVLDEIQSYRNTIWTEIMMFLTCYAKLLNMKVLIMSATLPHLEVLTGRREPVANLIGDGAKYFRDDRFRGRVTISYELLQAQEKTDEEVLFEHILKHAGKGKKILVEFIKKKRAEAFYQRMKVKEDADFTVLCMTGDDNQEDRKKILRLISGEQADHGVILIATQVVEAGVDIDMDIGYKDISKLDSEEQFLGRINRNFKRKGIVYFFNLDDAAVIYGSDYRMNPQFTLLDERMRVLLEQKDFHAYYAAVLNALKENRNALQNEKGLDYFIRDEVGILDFIKVSERMRLIEERQTESLVYLARCFVLEDGTEVDGKELWQEYKTLLQNQSMNYAKKQVRLSRVRSRMNYFIYTIHRNADLVYHDRIGELLYIEDGAAYFEGGRLNKALLESAGALFID